MESVQRRGEPDVFTQGGRVVHPRLLRLIQALLLPAILVVTGVLVAVPAQAQNDGWNYIVVQNGICGRNGGSVVQIYAAISGSDNYISTWGGGDYGDNIIYAKVQRGLRNDAYGWVICANGRSSKRVDLVRMGWVPNGGQTVWL